MSDEIETMEDDDESFTDGDPAPEDIDWDQVAKVQETFDTLPPLEALRAVYGDELVVD